MKLAQGIPLGEDVATIQDFERVFGNIVQSVLALAAIALFIMLLVGGFKYITSGGDPKNAEAAKLTLTYAIGGMVLVASAYLILRFVGILTGADVTNFVIVRP